MNPLSLDERKERLLRRLLDALDSDPFDASHGLVGNSTHSFSISRLRLFANQIVLQGEKARYAAGLDGDDSEAEDDSL
jgi:hypothetical protein